MQKRSMGDENVLYLFSMVLTLVYTIIKNLSTEHLQSVHFIVLIIPQFFLKIKELGACGEPPILSIIWRIKI